MLIHVFHSGAIPGSTGYFVLRKTFFAEIGYRGFSMREHMVTVAQKRVRDRAGCTTAPTASRCRALQPG